MNTLLQKLKNEVNQLKQNGDLIPMVSTILIFLIGSTIALCWMPEKMGYTPENLLNPSRLSKLHEVRNAHQGLVFAITFALAQLPLEYLSSKALKHKQQTKTILVIGATISAYIAFYYSF